MFNGQRRRKNVRSLMKTSHLKVIAHLFAFREVILLFMNCERDKVKLLYMNVIFKPVRH